MRRLFCITLILSAAPAAYAQWTGKAGINFIPVIAKSVEVTSEFSNRSWYALTADAGYTFNTGYTGISDYLDWDFYDRRRTSGLYARLGGRLYTPGFGPSREVRFYINPLMVISNYRQTALRSSPEDPKLPPVKVSASGTVLIPALRIGFTRPVSRKLSIDFGVQKSLNPKRDDMMGSRLRNYQPGAGSHQNPLFLEVRHTRALGYLQGYLTLKVGF